MAEENRRHDLIHIEIVQEVKMFIGLFVIWCVINLALTKQTKLGHKVVIRGIF